MKFSYQWLRELVPALSVSTGDLYRLLTTKTAECESIEPSGAHFAQVVAARVVSVEPLPKGKNKAVIIEVGEGKRASVICGAPNVRPGILAPWVPPGTTLGTKVIGRAIIEGVESEGMLASAAELGINRDAAGILQLADLLPGQALRGLEADWIIEIDNKSLTHRPDLWGHYGMAREVAAITGNSLLDPADLSLLPNGRSPVRIEIEDHVLCPRYSALLFENVKIGPSPLSLQFRLESVGINSISNVVDITNYVLAELAQPMHAFDADKLSGPTIFVRRARSGERLKALNGETYDLTEADLVIADASGPVALAGVIGGADSAISDSTTRILFESATFQAASVRLTSARHKLRTDASVRFEKSLDPENTLRGLARATALLRELSPEARPGGGVADQRSEVRVTEPISLPLQTVVRKLGKQVTEEQVTAILEPLGFGVSRTSPGLLTVTVPSWRATKDVSLKDDLVEEVGRMIGYGEILPTAPMVASVVPPANPMRKYLRSLRHQLAALGLSEVYNYSFVTVADLDRFAFKVNEHIGVRNPIASELTHLRRSLLPGLFRNLVDNVRNFDEFRLFEIGNEIHPASASELPYEVTHLAAVIYDAQGDERTFFEAKHLAESVFEGAQLVAAAEHQPYEHPARAADILWRGSPIGRLFEIHPSLLVAENIEGRAVFLDVDLKASFSIASGRQVQYTPLRKYPTSGFDISVVVPVRMAVGEVQHQLIQLAGKRLVSIEFIRQYEGAPLSSGQKSVSYRLEIGAPDRTLTSEEVGVTHDAIVKGMHGRGFEIRGLE